MRRDSAGGTILIAAILCVVCSVLVSASAVGLRGLQDANRKAYQQKNILAAAGETSFDAIETRIVDLATGEPTDAVDLKTYNQKSASKDPQLSVKIDAKLDIAGIKRREKFSKVYFVMDGDKLKTIILPVYGKGLWSTLYGYLAIDGDLNTVRGLTFYKHGETPGLGGEVDNPKWKALWPEKLIRNAAGEFKIEVIKGQVDASSKNADHQVDGLTGATITSRGVSKLVQYWLSDDGFGPLLARLKKEQQ
jgi:Na+-transporting NADH:ubiquinone oxidoreductase subunit C